jgi:hypothetical protein
MVYYFTDSALRLLDEEKIWELSGKMPQAKWKTCDAKKTIQQLTFEGKRSEYGFCNILGVKFDWDIKRWGDGGTDFVACGYHFQMKYNNWRPPTGELYFRDSQPWAPHVSVAILSVPVLEIVDRHGKGVGLGGIEYIGWTGRKRFDTYSRRTVWPGNDTPVTTMKAEHLKDMEELMRFLFPLRGKSSKDLKQVDLFLME